MLVLDRLLLLLQLEDLDLEFGDAAGLLLTLGAELCELCLQFGSTSRLLFQFGDLLLRLGKGLRVLLLETGDLSGDGVEVGLGLDQGLMLDSSCLCGGI